MIDQLRTMAIFQQVAELGSFRAAAKSLALSPSVISHHITQLEAQLGTPLLYRSTRRMSLTDAGAELLAASQQMTSAAQEGLAAINRRVKQPVGKLSITLNTSSASQPYARIYTGFARAYPKIQLSMHLTDRNVPLEGSMYDLAIRGKPDKLDDSAYRATRLGKINLGVVAAPAYVASHPPVKAFEDLATWDRIQAPAIPWATVAQLAGKTSATTEPRIAMSCDNFQMGRQFMLQGLGFIIEATSLFAQDVASGHAVRILPQLEMPLGIYGVYPANAPSDSPARLLIEYMVDQKWFAEEDQSTFRT